MPGLFIENKALLAMHLAIGSCQPPVQLGWCLDASLHHIVKCERHRKEFRERLVHLDQVRQLERLPPVEACLVAVQGT